MCLIYNAGVVPHFDMLRDALSEAPKVSQYITDFITSADQSKKMILKQLIEMTETFLVAQQDTAQAQCLLQLIGKAHSIFKFQIQHSKPNLTLVPDEFQSIIFFMNLSLIKYETDPNWCIF